MDIRNFFGRSPTAKPKAEVSTTPLKKEPKSSPSTPRRSSESTNRKNGKIHSKSPAFKVSPSPKAKATNGTTSSSKHSSPPKNSSPTKPVHEISSSDDDDNDNNNNDGGAGRTERMPPPKSPVKKQKMSADDFFESSSPSRKEKTSPKKPAEASPKKKNSADTDRHRDAGTRNGSRKSGASSSKSKSAKHPKLEITPKTKETPKKRKLNDDGGSDADDDDKEGSAHKRRKASSSVEPRPKASARASIGNGASYLAYLNREPPRHLGEKDHPEGSPGCLKNCTIVMTGVMDYVDKDEIKRVVEQCGGRITGSISCKTTHVIAGRDAGPAKVAKAHAVKAKVLEELEWFEFVESVTDKSSAFKAKAKVDPLEEVMMEIEEAEARKASPKREKSSPASVGKAVPAHRSATEPKTPKAAQQRPADPQPSTSREKASTQPPALMWVDKYMPATTKQIIGQQGDQSNVAKLRRWLTQWSTKQKVPFNKFKNPTGAGLRAALLSGPPGVGKTTSAHLVCKELGFEIIEMNASDTRSKRSLKEEVATLLSNRTLGNTGSGKRKHILIMDEVDGMSGNQDRGGVQELIQLIKSSMVPIICICNDRAHPKMRSLVNYCFDLRFYKPQVKQIQAALMSLCFKEGMKVPPKTIEEIIVASNQDIRQCVHSLNLFCAINGPNGKQQQVTKDVKIGPFDVVKKFLIAAEGGTMNLNERQSLFFNDYNAVPLFIQENYVKVQPKNCTTRRDLLRRLADSSESICVGDTVDRQIRSSNAWALLSVQAMYSAVIPSVRMQGTMREMVNFPGWFGKYSTTAKHARQAQALNAHMKCVISGDTFETTTQYMPLMARKIMRPLLKEGEAGVGKVVNFMDAYSLQRNDLDAMLELTAWNSQGKDPFADVPSKVKAKLTRSLNKNQMLRYATDDMIKSKGKKLKKEKIKAENDEDIDGDGDSDNDEFMEEADVDFD